MQWIRTVTLFAACVMLLASPTAGQIGQLPQELIRKTGLLTADEQDQVREYVQPLLTDLAGDDARARSRARSGLVAPPRTPGVSVAFQQAYTTLVIDALRPLAEAPAVPHRIAAIDVAGALGTVEGWQLVRPSLEAEEPAVRLAAAVAARSTLDAIASRFPAMNAGAASGVIDTLAGRLSAETDAYVADGVARSLLQGGQLVEIDGYQPAGRRAWEALSAALPTRSFETRGDNDLRAQETRLTLLGTLETLRTKALTRVGEIDPAITQAAASIAGESLAMVASQAQSSSEPLDPQLQRMSRMAFTVLSLVARQSGEPAPPADLASPPANPEDHALFFRSARTYVLSLQQQQQVPASRLRRWFE